MSDLTPKEHKLYTSLLAKLKKLSNDAQVTFTDDEVSMIDMLGQEGYKSSHAQIQWLDDRLAKAANTLPSDANTSHYEKAKMRTFKEIRDRASSQSMHEIMLVLYDTPEYKALGNTVWQMHYHIGHAIIQYVVANEQDVIKFLKGETL